MARWPCIFHVLFVRRRRMAFNMGKLSLAILDRDIRYMENFADFITGYYRHRFNLSTFTNAETLISHARSESVDIALISADECGDWILKLETGLIIVLSAGALPSDSLSGESLSNESSLIESSSSESLSNESLSRGPLKNIRHGSVDRYCGADKLVADILKIYASGDRLSTDTDAVSGGRENKIITVFSAEGGSGRTSVAIALCAHFARIKLRVLYINLDFMGPADYNSGGEKDTGLSEIIYTIKTRPEKLGLKLEALSRSAPGHGFFYIDPPIYPMDIDEIQPADIEILIARLRGAGLYDRVVIDTHNGLSLRNKALMELTDSICIIARGSAAGLKKLYMYKDQIDKCFGDQAGDIFKRCHIILNSMRSADGPDDNSSYHEDSGRHDGKPRLSASAAGSASGIVAEIAAAFSAKVSTVPFCEGIIDDYKPEALADPSNVFGAALAEVARRA